MRTTTTTMRGVMPTRSMPTPTAMRATRMRPRTTEATAGDGSMVSRPRAERTRTRAVSAPVREEESRTGTVGGGNGKSGGDGETPFEREYKDYATGYASVPGLAYENMGWVTEVEGEIPKEMVGTLLRNGPAMYERDGFVKSYLDGDGMVTSIAIKDGKAYFRNKFVRTEHFDKEEELGRYTEPSIFTASDPRKPAVFYRLFSDILGGNLARKQNGAYNVLNWGDSLVAVDYKKPYALNPDTLETIGHGACDLSSVTVR